MNLRNEARGRDCLVRTPVCNGDPATTVAAHWRGIGVSGLGLKAPDLLAAWCCSSCHTLVDTGRVGETELTRDDRELYLLRGIARTQAALIKEGKLKW